MTGRLSDAEVEALLGGAADFDGDLAVLAQVFDAIRGLAVPGPNVEYQHLYAAAASELRLSPVGRFARERNQLEDDARLRVVQRGVMAAVALVMLVVMSGGLAYAANGAKPGDLLYGLDRAFEVFGIGDRGADERLAEALALIALETEASDEGSVALGSQEAAAAASDEHGLSGHDNDVFAVGESPGDYGGSDESAEPTSVDDAGSTATGGAPGGGDPNAGGNRSTGETSDSGSGPGKPPDASGGQGGSATDDISGGDPPDDDPGPGNPTTTTTTSTTTTSTIAPIERGGDCDDDDDPADDNDDDDDDADDDGVCDD